MKKIKKLFDKDVKMNCPEELQIVFEKPLMCFVEYISETYNVPKDAILKKIKRVLALSDKKEEPPSIFRVVKTPFGNYVVSLDLEPTKLVVDPTTRHVVGFEGKDGSVLHLDKRVVDLCRKYKLRFAVPLLLPSNPTAWNVVGGPEDELDALNLIYDDEDDDVSLSE